MLNAGSSEGHLSDLGSDQDQGRGEPSGLVQGELQGVVVAEAQLDERGPAGALHAGDAEPRTRGCSPPGRRTGSDATR